MSVIFEHTFDVVAKHFDGPHSTLPLQFTLFYCAIGGIPSITLTLTGHSFYELCRYMRHQGRPNRSTTAASAFVDAINHNRQLELRTRISPIEDINDGIFITRFIARTAHSQMDCAIQGAERLVQLFALADVRGLTPWQRRKSYKENLEHCEFNACLHTVFRQALAGAVVYCCERHPPYDEYLDYVEGVRPDAPSNLALVTPHYYTTPFQGVAAW